MNVPGREDGLVKGVQHACEIIEGICHAEWRSRGCVLLRATGGVPADLKTVQHEMRTPLNVGEAGAVLMANVIDAVKEHYEKLTRRVRNDSVEDGWWRR